MGDVRVNASVGDLLETGVRDWKDNGPASRPHQSQEVQSAVALLRTLTSPDNLIVLVELSLLDTDVDLDDVLPDDASCSNVEVPYLRVAHKPIGETNGKTVSGERGVRVCLSDGVHIIR